MTILQLYARSCVNLGKALVFWIQHKQAGSPDVPGDPFLKMLLPDIPRAQYQASTVAASCLLASRTMHDLLPHIVQDSPGKKKGYLSSKALPPSLLLALQSQAQVVIDGLQLQLQPAVQGQEQLHMVLQQQGHSAASQQPKTYIKLLQEVRDVLMCASSTPCPCTYFCDEADRVKQGSKIIQQLPSNHPDVTELKLKEAEAACASVDAPLIPQHMKDQGLLALHMVELGRAVQISLPCYHACSNIFCFNLSGWTKKELCRRKCACKSGYCSKECSEVNWKRHKPLCTKLNRPAA
jgi:hypothetical protein